MVWYLGIWEEGPIFKWEDKSGLYGHATTPLPFGLWTPSGKIDDTSNIPTVAVHTSGSGKVPDVKRIGDAGVISERLKNIIEDIEPGIHQFFPVTLKKKSGEAYPGHYYIFHPTQYAPCVLLSKSGIRSKVIVERGIRKGLPHYNVHADEYVISRSAYGDRKIFGSLFVMNDGLFVSDEVMARIKTAKLKSVMAYPVTELDEPWNFEKEAPDLAAFLKDRPDIAATYQLDAF